MAAQDPDAQIERQAYHYTVDEIAKAFDRNPTLIRRWIKNGELPATKAREWPHPYLIKPSDVADLLLTKKKLRRTKALQPRTYTPPTE